jgi:hypothetical protein
MAQAPASRAQDLARAATSYQNYLNQLDASNVLTDPGDGGTIPVTESGTLLMDCAGVETRTLPDPTFIGQRLDLVLNNNTGTSVAVTAASDLDSVSNSVLTYTVEGSAARLVGIQVDGSDLVWRVFPSEGVAAAPTLS